MRVLLILSLVAIQNFLHYLRADTKEYLCFSSLYLYFACELKDPSKSHLKFGSADILDLLLTLFTVGFTVAAVPGLLMRHAFLMSTSVVLTQPGCKNYS